VKEKAKQQRADELDLAAFNLASALEQFGREIMDDRIIKLAHHIERERPAIRRYMDMRRRQETA